MFVSTILLLLDLLSISLSAIHFLRLKTTVNPVKVPTWWVLCKWVMCFFPWNDSVSMSADARRQSGCLQEIWQLASSPTGQDAHLSSNYTNQGPKSNTKEMAGYQSRCVVKIQSEDQSWTCHYTVVKNLVQQAITWEQALKVTAVVVVEFWSPGLEDICTT